MNFTYTNVRFLDISACLDKLNIYKNVKKNRFCASERRLGQKYSACGSHCVAGSIVSIPQAACSELSSGFEPAYVSGSNYKLFFLLIDFIV